LAVFAFSGVEAAETLLELDLPAESARAHVARHGFEMAALGLAGELDVAADAVDVDFLRITVEAQLAADAVDVEAATGDAGERDIGADHFDLHLGVARHLQIERGVAHARLGAPVEPALLVGPRRP